jgi:hypothetical protein
MFGFGGGGFGNMMGGLGDRLQAGGRALGGGQGAGNPYTQGTGGAYGRGSGGGYMGGGGGTAGEYGNYGGFSGGGGWPMQQQQQPMRFGGGGPTMYAGGSPNFDERTGQYRPGTGPVSGGRGQPGGNPGVYRPMALGRY